MSLCIKSSFIMVILYLSINSTPAPPTPSPSTFVPITAPTTSTTTFVPIPAPTPSPSTFGTITAPTTSTSAEPTPSPSDESATSTSAEPTPSPSDESTTSTSAGPTQSPSDESTTSTSAGPTPSPSEESTTSSSPESTPTPSTGDPTPNPPGPQTECCTPGKECTVRNPPALCNTQNGQRVYCATTLCNSPTTDGKGMCCYWDGSEPLSLDGNIPKYDEGLCCSRQSDTIQLDAGSKNICCDVDDNYIFDATKETHVRCCIRGGGIANKDITVAERHFECCSGKSLNDPKGIRICVPHYHTVN